MKLKIHISQVIDKQRSLNWFFDRIDNLASFLSKNIKVF